MIAPFSGLLQARRLMSLGSTVATVGCGSTKISHVRCSKNVWLFQQARGEFTPEIQTA
jgi:hypothetical protein